MRHLPLILVLLFAVLVFAQVCTHDYVSWDDDLLLYQDPYLNPPTTQSLHTLLTKVDAYHLYVPVTFTAWWAISHTCGAPTPGGGWMVPPPAFHAASLFVFLLTVALAYALLLLLIGDPVAAGFGAALYALHPLQVETVAWASELKDLLSGMFGLLTVLLFIVSRRRGSLGLYLLSTLCFVLGILSKPNVVMLPLLVIVVMVWLERRDAPDATAAERRAATRQSLLTTALWVLPWVALGLIHALITRKVQPAAPDLIIPMWQRLFVAGDALAFYLGKLVLPLQLSADYGRMPSVVVSSSWGYVTWLIPAAVLALAIITRRRSRWALPGLLWFAVALVPVLGLLPFDFQQYSTVADHYAYVALFGPALALAGLALHLKGFYPRLPVVLLLVLLAAQSGLQTITWSNNLVFWQHTLDVNPKSFLAHNNLGAGYQLQRKLPEAAQQFELALQIEPDDPDTTVNLGLLKAQLGDLARAKELLQKGLQLRPGDPKAQMMLGMIALKEKDYNTAISLMQRLLDMDPRNLTARYDLALAFIGQGRKAEARAQLQEILRAAPTMEPAQKLLDSLK